MIMDFKDLCHARYSVRAFKPDAIPAEKMEYPQIRNLLGFVGFCL